MAKRRSDWTSSEFDSEECCQRNIPFLKISCNHSLQTDKLSDDWVDANVAPGLKKGSTLSGKLQADIPHMCLCQITQTHHM